MHGGDPCPNKNASLQGPFSAFLAVKTQPESITFSSADLQLHAFAFSVARWCISPVPFSFQIAHQWRSRVSSFHNFWHLTWFFFFLPGTYLLFQGASCCFWKLRFITWSARWLLKPRCCLGGWGCVRLSWVFSSTWCWWRLRLGVSGRGHRRWYWDQSGSGDTIQARWVMVSNVRSPSFIIRFAFSN